MAAHKTNRLLKWGVPLLIAILAVTVTQKLLHHAAPDLVPLPTATKNTASQDSAAESLDTLTAQLSATEHKVQAIVTQNQSLQQQNQELLHQLQSKPQGTAELAQQIEQLKAQFNAHPTGEPNLSTAKPITLVSDVTEEWPDSRIKAAATTPTLTDVLRENRYLTTRFPPMRLRCTIASCHPSLAGFRLKAW